MSRATVLSDLADYFESEGEFYTIQEYDAQANKPLPTHMVKRYYSYARLKHLTQHYYPEIVLNAEEVVVGDTHNENSKRIGISTTTPTLRNKK